MPGRYEDSIYEMLSGESVIPGKVAGRLDVDYKIAGDMLMHLPLTSRYVRYKASDRINVFWRGKV